MPSQVIHGGGAQQASTYVHKAVSLARNRRFDEALLAFLQASQADPHNVQAQFGQGTCYAAIGDIDNAIAAFRRTVALDPKAADAHFRLGSLLSETGNVSEGFSHYMQRAQLRYGGAAPKPPHDLEPLHKIKHDREQQDYLAAHLGHPAASIWKMANGRNVLPSILPTLARPCCKSGSVAGPNSWS
jgi:tetratricopeptide (TPR) repeat protein